MNIEILSEDKNELEVKIDNVTIAELLRVYLNEQGVEFAAWKREHPSKPAILRIKTSSGTVKKAVGDAVDAINKDFEKILSAVKKK